MKDHARDVGLLLLRLVFGGSMALAHGLGKLRMILDGNQGFGDPLGLGPRASLILAASAELLFALLVVAGIWTRWTALFPLVTMAVAFFVVHASDPFPKKELALLYLAAFAAIALLGPGRYSADGWRKRSP